MGYHVKNIDKGTYGEVSKITEEYHEFIDAMEQNNPLMALQELSDLVGAINGFVKQYNLTLDDILTMTVLTEKVFVEGYRK